MNVKFHSGKVKSWGDAMPGGHSCSMESMYLMLLISVLFFGCFWNTGFHTVSKTQLSMLLNVG